MKTLENGACQPGLYVIVRLFSPQQVTEFLNL